MNNENQTPLHKGYNLKHYKIIEVLGQCGFSKTYKALDRKRNKPVVIKEYFPQSLVLRRSQQTEVSLLSSGHNNNFKAGLVRFEKEAQVLSQFEHPNIVRVLSLFRDNGTSYFVMDYIEGQSLKEHLQQVNRPFTENQIRKHVLPALKGLSLIHKHKTLHLDIKPDNILSTTYGEPILIDFGGARVDSAQASMEISEHSTMIVTDGYSPPEQYTRTVVQTKATDIYAFGMTLYSLMTNNTELIKSIDRREILMNDSPDPLPSIRSVSQGYSKELYRAVEACIQLKLKDRPQNVEELLHILQMNLEEIEEDLDEMNEDINGHVDKENSSKDSKKSKLPYWLFAFTILCLSVGAFAFLQFPNDITEHNSDSKIAHYVTHGNGMITDTQTNLMWKCCSEGQSWSSSECIGDVTKMRWENAMTTYSFANYDDWRLPTENELSSLVYCYSNSRSEYLQATDKECKGDYQSPTINTKIFPKTFEGPYWTVSTYESSKNRAKIVNFRYGYNNRMKKSNKNAVRLVRDI